MFTQKTKLILKDRRGNNKDETINVKKKKLYYIYKFVHKNWNGCVCVQGKNRGEKGGGACMLTMKTK